MSKLVRITDVAYNHLKQSTESNLEPNVLDMMTTVSDLITTFLNAKMRWNEEKGLFDLYDGRLYIELEPYLSRDSTFQVPLIEALRRMADLATWKKFVEILEKTEKK